MRMNLECINCIIGSASNSYDKYGGDKDGKLSFMKDVYKLVGTSSKDDTSPYLKKCINDLLKKRFDIGDEYRDEKILFNSLLLEIEEEIYDEIKSSGDPLLNALRYAMTGNFIDFGALEKVESDKLFRLIESSKNQKVDVEEYRSFSEELAQANKLVYLLDNAGEIVFDKLFMKIIKDLYPELNITAIVRGYPVLNDVILEDALDVGLNQLVDVVDNGTDIPGTQLDKISSPAHRAIERADLIISKGQGNFESLSGSGLNIYYILLCKCDLFIRRFMVPQFTGLFVNELRL